MPPVPDEANEYLPGLFLTSAMNSFMSFTGTFFGFTVITFGTVTRLMIIEKSFTGSYGIFAVVAGMVASVDTVATPRM